MEKYDIVIVDAGQVVYDGYLGADWQVDVDAAAHMVEEIHTYYPRPKMHEKYMEIYERYEKVYQAVRPLV